jgi:hypothetical protein
VTFRKAVRDVARRQNFSLLVAATGRSEKVRSMNTILLRIPLLLGCLPLVLGCSDGGSGNDITAGSGGSGNNTAGSSPSGGAGSGGMSTTGGNTTAGVSGTGPNVSGQGGQASGGASGASSSGGGGGGTSTPSTEKFSFFVTSLKAMVELSGSKDGFGGDLRFGETGEGAGLKGADKICKTIAEKSMPGNNKTWRAFLSATKGEDGNPVHAIDRIGEGPWYDRAGRLVSQDKTSIANVRPEGADEAIVNDLPNEDGVPNHEPDVGQGEVDNHDILTGTNEEGMLFNSDAGYTCNDWTSSEESGEPHCGHSWPRMGGFGGPGGGGGFGENWMSALNESGCAPGVWIVEAGPPGANGTKSVGDGGGYGGIYCFALTP